MTDSKPEVQESKNEGSNDSAAGLSAAVVSLLKATSRNKHIIGSCENPFQASMVAAGKERKDAKSDPLNLPLFDGLGYACVPMVGVYGDNYDPLLPDCLLELDMDRTALTKQLPASLVKALSLGKEEQCQLFFMVHPLPQRGPCQHFTCESMSELNMMQVRDCSMSLLLNVRGVALQHAWALPDAKFRYTRLHCRRL